MRRDAAQSAHLIGADRLASFVLSENWPPAEAFALFELLGQMREQLFVQYGDQLMESIREREKAAATVALGNRSDSPR